MICGFLHRKEEKIVNGRGEEILLQGWGLGNWMLAEGYMWRSASPRFDRPRRIERVIEELAGKDFAAWFWKQFRESYIGREDIAAMRRLGYNSVRIPFNYRLFMEDGPGTVWKEEGFLLLDRCLEWCEAEGLYAFLDLHGAPGGQTGSNIDDSVDDVPRLFMDRHCREAAIALWVRLARRYAGREVVGGYDLLNEPIIPAYAGNGDFDHLIPELKQFYKDVIREIRRVDKVHLLSLEGPHWATSVSIFDEDYDDNMVIHFHRYAEPPEIACLKPYIDAGRQRKLPLWMGETGENTDRWYAALYPLAQSLGVGYNLWPWKKMDCTNSPCSIRRPEGWQEILDYIEGGPHPGYARAAKILCEYLENIRYENCIHNDAVTHHVLRCPPFSIQAADFDSTDAELAWAYSAAGTVVADNPAGVLDASDAAPDNDAGTMAADGAAAADDPAAAAGSDAANCPAGTAYRARSGMEIVELYPRGERRFTFDSGWERFALVLCPGDGVTYTFDTTGLPSEKVHITMEYECEDGGSLAVGCQPGELENKIPLAAGSGEYTVTVSVVPDTGRKRLFVRGLEGRIRLKTIGWTVD